MFMCVYQCGVTGVCVGMSDSTSVLACGSIHHDTTRTRTSPPPQKKTIGGGGGGVLQRGARGELRGDHGAFYCECMSLCSGVGERVYVDARVRIVPPTPITRVTKQSQLLTPTPQQSHPFQNNPSASLWSTSTSRASAPTRGSR